MAAGGGCGLSRMVCGPAGIVASRRRAGRGGCAASKRGSHAWGGRRGGPRSVAGGDSHRRPCTTAWGGWGGRCRSAAGPCGFRCREAHPCARRGDSGASAIPRCDGNTTGRAAAGASHMVCACVRQVHTHVHSHIRTCKHTYVHRRPCAPSRHPPMCNQAAERLTAEAVDDRICHGVAGLAEAMRALGVLLGDDLMLGSVFVGFTGAHCGGMRCGGMCCGGWDVLRRNVLSVWCAPWSQRRGATGTAGSGSSCTA